MGLGALQVHLWWKEGMIKIAEALVGEGGGRGRGVLGTGRLQLNCLLTTIAFVCIVTTGC